MNSLQGHLLIASPHLPDPNFFRSVVLIVEHTEQGALGLVLNRPSLTTLSEIWNDLGETDLACNKEDFVHVGGPLNGPLMAVHSQESWADNKILPGVFFATHKDNLNQIVSQGKSRFLIFNGYSGWGAGQLEGEMKAGGWLTTRATPEYVFHDPETIWKKVSDEIGSKILMEALNIKQSPGDPSLN